MKACWPPGSLGCQGTVLEFVVASCDRTLHCDVMTAPEPAPSDFDHVVYHSDVDPLREDEMLWQDPTAMLGHFPAR